MNKMDIIKEVREKLIRRDGRLNSPAIMSPKNATLVAEVVAATSYLDTLAPFTRRWWHLLNGDEQPRCGKCQKRTRWNIGASRYDRFCSQFCAVTSEEASQRTSQQFKGIKLSNARRQKQSKRMAGHAVSQETKDKIRDTKIGKKNPAYQKPAWNRGLYGHNNPLYGRKKPGFGYTGEENAQFGKSPSPAAGRGVWGKFNGKHFRSSLEMFYLMYWYEANVVVESAETNEFRVKYINAHGNLRTYSPDFVIRRDGILVEIKPEKMHSNPDTLRKLNALQEQHLDISCQIWGFNKIKEFIRQTIEQNIVDSYKESGLLSITDEQLVRLKKNYVDILRATF